MRTLCLFGVLLLCSATTTSAVSVRSWSASTAEEFAQGKFDGTALDDEGRVRLAPELKPLWGPAEGIVWSVQPFGEQGAFAGLSGPGRLLQIGPAGVEELWRETDDESLVTALAADGKGGVFFGVSPGGRVLHAGGPDGVRTVVETGATFVWALATDDEGRLFIGTGVPGGVLRVEPDGSLVPLFDSGDDPVRSLAMSPDGGWVAGTGGRGLVVRFGPDGAPFVLLDAEEAEVVSVAVDSSGTVFALTATGPKQTGSRTETPENRTPSNSVRVTATPPPDKTDANGNGQPRKAEPESKKPTLSSPPGGALYRLDPDGGVRKLWDAEREMPFAMVVDRAGRLIVATGGNGRIFMLDGEGRSTRLLRIASDQASAMAVAAGNRILIGGTSDARVSTLDAGPRNSGAFLSPAVDAGSVADWGRVRWQADRPGGAKLMVEARCGNTADPDRTWSDWVALRTDDDSSTAEPDLPASRWFQLRVHMSSKKEISPVLRGLELFYLPRNRKPVVSELSVEPPGVVWTKGPAQTSNAVGPWVADDPIARRTAASLSRSRHGGTMRRAYEAGGRTFAWNVQDPDGDLLKYTVEVRQEGRSDWILLADQIEERFLSWDARSMPDGLYRMRLTVSDASENPNGTHLTDQRTSDFFKIDNTRPTVGSPEIRASGDGYDVIFEATDPGGSIAALEIARDGGGWKPFNPLDGVADSERESYRVRIDPEHGDEELGGPLRVRVTDAAGNLGGDVWVLDEP